MHFHALRPLFPLLLISPTVLAQVLFDERINATNTSYDYVVIGGGVGGLTVASRLAENPSITVLVLEAGPWVEDLPEVFIPGMIGHGQSFTTLNWAYHTTPQAHLNNRQAVINGGRALGGSSIINSMMFTRAQREQHDAWSTLSGSSLWKWDSILPYFKKVELFTPPNPEQTQQGQLEYDPNVHGLAGSNPDGRVKVGFPNYFFEQSAMWMEAITKGRGPSQMKRSRDMENGDVVGRVGVSGNAIDASNNTRCSATCAYYTPFRDKPNFTVLTNSTAVRILWSAGSQPLTASRVEYIDYEGNLRTVNIGREVILSAGAIGSPKVMELSGVGNATVLRSAGIDPVLELATVGENFADHLHNFVSAFTNATMTNDVVRANRQFSDEQLALWHHNRTGLYSAAPRALSIVGPSHIFPPAILRRLLREAEEGKSHYAKEFANGNTDLEKGILRQFDLMLRLWQREETGVLEINVEPGYYGFISSRPARNYTTIITALYHPFSRGRTHVTSSDHNMRPATDPNYWGHPLDVKGHVAGIQLGRRQLRMAPLDSIYQGEFEPGVAGVSSPGQEESDRQVEEWGRGVVDSDNHATGSMSMMPKELGGVVDEKLRVYGTGNVRVVDASIIPMPLSAHIMSTVYMIGERAADFIKETWN